jgi:hypothetical protein
MPSPFKGNDSGSETARSGYCSAYAPWTDLGVSVATRGSGTAPQIRCDATTTNVPVQRLPPKTVRTRRAEKSEKRTATRKLRTENADSGGRTVTFTAVFGIY